MNNPNEVPIGIGSLMKPPSFTKELVDAYEYARHDWPRATYNQRVVVLGDRREQMESHHKIAVKAWRALTAEEKADVINAYHLP